MLSNLTGWHFLVILVVILLLFGAPKLPGLARSLGQSMKIFKSEITPDRTDETRTDETRTDEARTDETRPNEARPVDPADSSRASSTPRTDSGGAPHPKA